MEYAFGAFSGTMYTRGFGIPAAIESPSTSGDISSNTRNTALLASEYAEKRGGTTTAFGHRRRARASPMAVRTPYAFAS